MMQTLKLQLVCIERLVFLLRCFLLWLKALDLVVLLYLFTIGLFSDPLKKQSKTLRLHLIWKEAIYMLSEVTTLFPL